MIITLLKVLFLGLEHEGVAPGRLSNGEKWRHFFAK
jgi:hypothetical protein